MFDIGRRLRKARLDLNLSAAQVAEESGLGENTIYRVERGENPYLSTVLALLEVYELPLSYLEED